MARASKEPDLSWTRCGHAAPLVVVELTEISFDLSGVRNVSGLPGSGWGSHGSFSAPGKPRRQRQDTSFRRILCSSTCPRNERSQKRSWVCSPAFPSHPMLSADVAPRELIMRTVMRLLPLIGIILIMEAVISAVRQPITTFG